MFNTRKIIFSILFLITLSITAYVVLVVVPSRMASRAYEGAKKIGEDIRNAFQFTPKVTVNNTIVLQQQTPILELATVNQRFRHEYVWVNTWMNSTKKISINGTFEAKAGFDLRETFSVDVYDDKVIVTLPRPKLLSISSMHDLTFRDEQGIWNWVNAQDRIAAINAFTRDAQRYAEAATFIADSKVNVEAKLKDIMKMHGKELVLRYEESVVIDRMQ